MTKEISRFLIQKDLQPRIESLLPPGCSWETLLSEGKALGPDRLLAILREAKALLETAPGPNLARRYDLAQGWFNCWFRLIQRERREEVDRPSLFIESHKLIPVDKVATYLAENQVLRNESGVLFVAGAEGHAGHFHAIRWMADHLGSWPCPIWVFEQDSYLTKKERGSPFLPLVVRLSMWHYHPQARVITVAPERDMEVPEARHYKEIFDCLGVTFCFAEELDPLREEKIRRGEEASFLIIPHLPVEATAERVEKLFPGAEEDKAWLDEQFMAAFIQESTPPPDSKFIEV
jgi:hypothetical protein